MDEKGQGALEYLIITAAVLAIAAVVVTVLSGALGGGKGKATVSTMKTDASDCATALGSAGIQPGSGQAINSTVCKNICSGDVWKNASKKATTSGAAGVDNATAACKAGKPSWIISK